MMGMFNKPSDYVKIGSVTVEGETFNKYKVPSEDDRMLWHITDSEVWYDDERLFGALDEIERLRAVLGRIADIPNDPEWDGNASAPIELAGDSL